MQADDQSKPMASDERGHPKGIGFYVTREMLPAYPFLHSDAYDHYILGFWYKPTGMQSDNPEQFRAASDHLHEKAMPFFSLVDRLEQNHEDIGPYWRPFSEITAEGASGLVDAWYLTSLFDIVEFTDIFDLSIITLSDEEGKDDEKYSYIPLKGQEITTPYTEKESAFAKKLFAAIKASVIHNEVKIPYGRRHLLNAVAEEPSRYEEVLVDVKDYCRFLVEKADIPHERLPGAVVEVYENSFGSIPRRDYPLSRIKKETSDEDMITVPIQIVPFIGTTRQGQFQSQDFGLKLLGYSDGRTLPATDNDPDGYTKTEFANYVSKLLGKTIGDGTAGKILADAGIGKIGQRTSSRGRPDVFPRDESEKAGQEYVKKKKQG